VSVADAAGDPVTINRYDEYGLPAASNTGRFQYTGQAWLPEVAVYYYKARIYDPRLGRFLQTDPVGYQDDLDLYTYVGNDPLDKTDPTGQIVLVDDAILLAGGAAVAAVAVYEACDSCQSAVASVGQAIGDAIERIGSTLESRSKAPPPLPEAEGRPHSVPDDKGGYTTYGPRDPGTGKPESEKQYRPAGKSHGDVPRPNVKERQPNTRPDGARVPGKPVVRPPTPDEVRKPQAPPSPQSVFKCVASNIPSGPCRQ
jgi:RHS repeat-associated protein